MLTGSTAMQIISPQLVREAAERIKPLARRTPVMTSRSVDERAGVRVFLKCENLQRERRVQDPRRVQSDSFAVGPNNWRTAWWRSPPAITP